MNPIGSDMNYWAPTKRAKIYEALSEIADGRIVPVSDNVVHVFSSDKSKSYVVEWSDDHTQFMSNDNASFYQGYLGYPIVAVILSQKVIDFDGAILKYFANVPWKKLNTKYKNNYEKAIGEFLDSLRSERVDVQQIETEVTR